MTSIVENNIINPHSFRDMSESDVSKLKESITDIQGIEIGTKDLPLMHIRRAQTFWRWYHHKLLPENGGNPLTPAEWVNITRDDFNEYKRELPIKPPSDNGN